MTRIRGVPVVLTVKTRTGTDPLGAPVFEETTETVENVLIGEPTTQDAARTWDLYNKRIAYTLAIPKGDAHVWENTTVRLPPPFSGLFRTVGIPTAGIEENIPLDWNKKVHLERYG